MIAEIQIQNYKSIDKLRLELGRVNVFIGENGAGKSNILEAIALAAAPAANQYACPKCFCVVYWAACPKGFVRVFT